jgi:RNA polymerase sigma-70 factor (ECF subfamily)
MAEELGFRELIERIRAGDDQAAAELVRRYEPTIRRVARVRLLDTRLQRVLDSMDICQSVFASFFVRAALGEYELEEPAQLLNLLVTMSKRKLVDRAREQGALRRDFHRLREGSLSNFSDIAAGVTPSQEVSAKELLQEFRKRLSPEEQGLADARAQGLDWNQIAADRGGTPEALRKRLVRGIARVGQELGLDGFQDG